ncbi:hypothetical protein CEY46_22540 [Salmonella enterica subsp. enterica serovar Poona]|nr:hypothetical protein [Salmonella enterica subsp. enterica serovar Poona]EDT7188182.1 hypothetical protein [Salmonella enterica subsp. enterica]EHJ0380018.1 hypothetical protein [Salmonella enterica]EKP5434232.1 hypothetical protein [Salmonella enterica]HCZ4969879.1 hypothetical protein [Salmonella enterica subsp. enterica serovar Saintpaul str. CFSAN004160]
MTLLKNVVRLSANLPARVFHKKFSRYFFFDNDICTSDDLISVTKLVIGESLGYDLMARVFASSDFKYLGDLHMNEDWVAKIASLSTEMNDSGDYGGLIILDQKKQWAIFQKTPVEEGVLGINSNKKLEAINDLIYENFVDCEKFKEWLEEKTSHDVELVKSVGRNYLMSIVENYREA